MARTTLTRGKSRKEEPEEDDEKESFTPDDGVEEQSSELMADNAGQVPLFTGSDGRSLKSITAIRIYKFEKAGYAYKGQVPTTTTLETIGQQFGDGLYTMEGINAKHKVLAVNENVRISLGEHEKQPQLPHMGKADSAAEIDRVERLATKAADATVASMGDFTKAMSSMYEASAAREREFLANQNRQQSEFMQGMLTAQQQGFQQAMTMMTAGNAIVMQQLLAMNSGERNQQTDPKELMQLFMQGITLGRDLSDGGDEEDDGDVVQGILRGGFQLLKATRQATAGALPTNNPRGSTPDTKRKSKKVAQALRLLEVVRSSGLTGAQLADILNAAKSQASPERPPPDTEEADEEEGDEDESDESDDDSYESEDDTGASPAN